MTKNQLKARRKALRLKSLQSYVDNHFKSVSDAARACGKLQGYLSGVLLNKKSFGEDAVRGLEFDFGLPQFFFDKELLDGITTSIPNSPIQHLVEQLASDPKYTDVLKILSKLDEDGIETVTIMARRLKKPRPTPPKPKPPSPPKLTVVKKGDSN